MQKILRVAAYARVSTEEQKKFGFSIAAQTDKLQKWVDDNGYQLIDMFVDEGFSAGSMRRPALQEMLSRLDEIDIIVFTRLDRFSRNVLDANKTLEQLKKHKVAMISIEEDDIDTTTADGMFMFNLKVSLAERELGKTSERIKSVFDYKIKDGQAIFGNTPFGYTIEKIDGVKRVVKDKGTAHIVDEIFSYFSVHHSIRQTMTYINDKYNLTMVYHTYANILNKPFYMGEYKGNPSYCEPYITPTQYYHNQELIKKNVRQRKSHNIYLFTGMIRCPECGSLMAGQHKANADKHSYHYRCVNHYTNKRCSNARLINETLILEPYIVQNIDQLVNEYILSTEKVSPRKSDNTKSRITDIKSEMDNLNYMFVKSRISPSDYDKMYEKLEHELSILRNVDEDKLDTEHLKKFLNSGWQDIYESLSRENKRALWSNVIKEIVLDDEYNISIKVY